MNKLLIAHNLYRSSSPSGENIVVERETELLRAAGVTALRWDRHSDDLISQGMLARLRTAWNLLHARNHRAELRAYLREVAPDLLHAHNVWPLFTYELLRVANELGIPTVQTLHNCRLIASNTHFIGPSGARLPIDGEDRAHLGRLGAMHSRFANAIYTKAVSQVWKEDIPNQVRAFICLSEFQRSLFIAAGMNPEKLVVKPNFLPNPGPPGSGPGSYALYIGRLAEEKGIAELIRAWPGTGLPLRVIGDGPLRDELNATTVPGVQMVGRLDRESTQTMLRNARMLVMNSTWYEPFGLVLIEALAAGTPCLVPTLGSMPEIISNGVHGRHMRPGDDLDLVTNARRLWEEAPKMRSRCRAEYEAKYTPERNLILLKHIYSNISHGHPPGSEMAGL
jgi:glycosyltransferase involved in cell wall biosynthesis